MRAGGLEVAVRAALKRLPGIWFGWSGRVKPRSEIETRTIVRRDNSYVVVDLAEDDFEEYYNGFANRVLWPVLHYRLNLAEFSRRNLSGYLRVNDYFACELDKILKPDDLVWVHDYHLIPLARALRNLGHHNRIGFFLHTPCPPPEILAAMPNHERLIAALDQYDLVGFQTDDDAFNFSRYLTRERGLRSQNLAFLVGDRTLQVDVFPVGIAVASFARLAQRAERAPFVQKVLASLAGRAMIIGVDRLDYSKGIPQRMEAFERFLTTRSDWLGKVTYLQISPKSRSEIPEYATIGELVGATAGRINGAYGEADWTPIRYVNRAHSRSLLAGLYRSARAVLVTPLRDGMNLVVKEYIAAQNPEDPGVPILSRFAGAARECEAALLVNPYDVDSVAAAISRALSMSLGERRERQAALFKVISVNDIDHWADRFLKLLSKPSAANRSLASLSPLLIR